VHNDVAVITPGSIWHDIPLSVQGQLPPDPPEEPELVPPEEPELVPPEDPPFVEAACIWRPRSAVKVTVPPDARGRALPTRCTDPVSPALVGRFAAETWTVPPGAPG
jgi:hypothetical protein